LIGHWGSRVLLFDQYETVSAGYTANANR